MFCVGAMTIVGAINDGLYGDPSTDVYKRQASKLARSMLKKDSSFVTVISGCDVSEEQAEALTKQLSDKVSSNVGVTRLVGGQPVYYYIISVE